MASIGKGLEAYIRQQVTETAMNQIAEAREQANKIRDEGQAALEQARKLNQQKLERLRREERQQALAKVNLAVSKQEAAIHEQALAGVWQQADQRREDVVNADASVRARILAALITDAALQLDGGELEVQATTADQPLITPAFLSALQTQINQEAKPTVLSLQPEPAKMIGGVIVTQLHTSSMVVNSFDARIALVKELLRGDVFRILDTGNIKQQQEVSIGNR